MNEPTPTKQCPWCAETIRAEAVKCRYCGSLVQPGFRLRGFSDPWIRPLAGRMLAGVCAGLADQFGVSVTILRLAFVLGVIFSGGVFVLVYGVLWLLMPSEDDLEPHSAVEPWQPAEPPADRRP